ncbi:YncE family protein [Mycobacterium sp. 94-17]|uniref:WD40 repeat domain-containing protein n=1 Tax=Mycobacterium sp. 94-17 TaxID=2986147 RepID=UPI002D1EE044|nr:YncE family protein [Mycobacterium sp. 94-17]MEB4211960.1 YncE family protein [Mycobacterium sp. 94-17]
MNDLNGPKAAHDHRDGLFPELDTTSVVRVPLHHGAISDIDISPDGRRLVATHYGRNVLSVIDAKTCRVASTIAGPAEPFAVAMSSADSNYAYVSTASAGYDAIEVVDVVTNWRIATHPLANSVSDLTVSPDGRYLYASRNAVRGADVTVLDTTSGELEVVDLATAPGISTACVRISADGRRLYVGMNAPTGGALAIIETRTRSDNRRVGGRSRIVGRLDVGLPVRDVALSDDGATAYVASCDPVAGAVLDVVDTRVNRIVSTHKIPEITGPLTRITLSRDGARAYLVSDDRITVVSTHRLEVAGDITVSQQPSCVVESPDGSHLYVADYLGVVTAARITPAAPAQTHAIASVGDLSLAGWLPELHAWEPVLA